MLVVVCGLPGTGKSTLADGISGVRGIAVASVDPIESAIVRAGIDQGFETGLAAYLVAEALADAWLTAGLDAIVDAVSAVEPARDMWRGLAGRHRTPLRIIECSLRHEPTARERLATRRRGLAIPEPSWADVERRAGEWTPWPEPHLVVDTAEPAEAVLARVLGWLDAAG